MPPLDDLFIFSTSALTAEADPHSGQLLNHGVAICPPPHKRNCPLWAVKMLIVKVFKRIPAENHFKSIGPLIDFGNFTDALVSLP